MLEVEIPDKNKIPFVPEPEHQALLQAAILMAEEENKENREQGLIDKEEEKAN